MIRTKSSLFLGRLVDGKLGLSLGRMIAKNNSYKGKCFELIGLRAEVNCSRVCD